MNGARSSPAMVERLHSHVESHRKQQVVHQLRILRAADSLLEITLGIGDRTSTINKRARILLPRGNLRKRAFRLIEPSGEDYVRP